MKEIAARGLLVAIVASVTAACCAILAAAPVADAQATKFEREVRARDLGVPLEGTPGPLDSITDVKGVEVGYRTLISGDGKLVVGRGQCVPALLPFFRAERIPWILCLPDGSRKTVMGR